MSLGFGGPVANGLSAPLADSHAIAARLRLRARVGRLSRSSWIKRRELDDTRAAVHGIRVPSRSPIAFPDNRSIRGFGRRTRLLLQNAPRLPGSGQRADRPTAQRSTRRYTSRPRPSILRKMCATRPYSCRVRRPLPAPRGIHSPATALSRGLHHAPSKPPPHDPSTPPLHPPTYNTPHPCLP